MVITASPIRTCRFQGYSGGCPGSGAGGGGVAHTSFDDAPALKNPAI